MPSDKGHPDEDRYVYNFLGLKPEQHLESESIGRGTGDAVSEQYTAFFPFEGGRIVKIEVSIGDDAYVDLERQLMAALARD